MAWTVETYGKVVDDELDGFGSELKSRLARIVSIIERYGPESLRMPQARHLSGPLWELRLQGPNRIGRAIYLTYSGQRVIILRAFIKKTRKTPPREIEIALERARKVMV